MTDYSIEFKTTVTITDENGDVIDSWEADQTVAVDETIEFGYGRGGYGGPDASHEDEGTEGDDA